ncbi:MULTISPECIES: PTS sugar transporter subunit IIA [Lactobacillus]|uniref:PTS fructose transporter subunit IIA n=1 Tax=Lactobacillus xujianguonis TaxID=2495899 RepID=A0A437SWT2_9LACO|nr:MULTISPECIES: PTS fructose transporter subunit IIA [Lactobacillus]RVU71362.1 PTS fructose transporter subunit IIA [Lactobacillus xujianguonis]RVU76977.1 PTS fructose transporter subunit IIA [Lactobacillus xujianguonis]
MTDILIASHGHMASGIQSSLNILTGMGDQVKVIDAYVDDSDYTPQIEQFIKEAKKPAVIFTDLLGGSVNQKVTLKASSEKDVFIVTQMNLAIIMAVLLDSEPLTKDHLQKLIKQSQVQLVELAEPATEESDDNFFG